MINKNKLFRNIHIYVSLFFLPVALLYAISGVAYIFGANQDTLATKTTHTVSGVSLEKGQEEQALLEILKAQGIKIPANTKVKADRKQGGFTMGGAHYSVNAKQNAEELVLATTTRSLLGDIIMLHKDKGEWYFSVLAVGFGAALILLYLSGLMITLFASKKDRQAQLAVLALGIFACILLAYLSL